MMYVYEDGRLGSSDKERLRRRALVAIGSAGGPGFS